MNFKALSLEEKEQYFKDHFRTEFVGKQSKLVKLVDQINNNRKSNPEKLITIEGIWAFKQVVMNRIRIKHLFICPEQITSQEALNLIHDSLDMTDGRKVNIISSSTLEKMSEIPNPAGIMAVCYLPMGTLSSIPSSQNSLVIVLDGLEIPGNVGTIIRSADGTDTDAVILTNRKTRITHPKIMRSSQGSLLNKTVIESEFAETVQWLQDHNYEIVLADTRATENYFDHAYSGNTAIVMGSERYGISREWYQLPHKKIAIPMFGSCDSLNVGIASTILLYEASLKKKQMMKR